MGIIIRQSLKNSIVTYIGVAIGTINVLFLYNKFLTTEQLGLYTAFISFPLVFASFAHLGTPHVGVRFYSYFANSENKNNGFLSYLLLVPLLGFILFLVTYFFANNLFINIYAKNSPLLINYYWIFPALTFMLLYQSVLEAYSKVYLRIVVPAIIREIFLKISNSGLAILFGFHYISFNQLIGGIVIVNFLALIFLFVYIKILGKLFLTLDFSFIKKPFFKDMFYYGLWTMLGGATASALPHLEKLMLPAYNGGLEKTAIFNIALSIGMIIAIPRNAIASISDPLLAEHWKKNELIKVGQIYEKSALNLLIIGIFLFLGVWCNIDSIFAIIPNSTIYIQGKMVVLIVGLYSVFDMGTGLNSEILKNSPYYKLDFTFYILRFIILLCANLILIPLLSYNGAALAMLISVIVYNLVKFLFIKYRMGLQPFNVNTLKVLTLGIFTFLFTLILPVFEGNIFIIFFNILIKSVAIILIFGGTVVYLNISEDLNKLIYSFKDKYLR